MAPLERLTNGLWYQRVSPSVSVASVGERTAPDPMLRFRRGTMNGRRLHVDLVLLGGERTVEVSFHPAAAVDVVRGRARRRACDGNGWLGALVGAVVDDGSRWGTWCPPAGAPAHAVLGGLAHPLLGAAYDAGVGAAAEVPRWASAALAEESVPAAAVRLFGARMASRAVVAALAGFLVGRARLAWWQLAAAVASADVVEPDELASALAAMPAGAGADPVAEVAVVPSIEDVAVLREGFRRLEHGRTRRLVVDAVRSGGEVGVRRLASAMRALVDLGDDVRWPPPVRLDDLEAVLLRASAVDPAPPLAVAPPMVAPGPVLPAWTTPRRAPPTRRSAPDAPFVHADEVRRRFDGVALAGGDLELVLPRTPQELAAWGRMLDNCLADFAAAVAEGRSVIVGVRRRRALVAALELRPDLGAVVQFLGARNRVPPATVTAPVLHAISLASGTPAVGAPSPVGRVAPP